MPRPCNDKTITPLRTTKRLWKWILVIVFVVVLSVIRFSQVTTTTTRDVSTKQFKQSTSTIHHGKPFNDNTTNKKKQPYNGTVQEKKKKKKKKRHKHKKSKEVSQRQYPANETKNETKVLSTNEETKQGGRTKPKLESDNKDSGTVTVDRNETISTSISIPFEKNNTIPMTERREPKHSKKVTPADETKHSSSVQKNTTRNTTKPTPTLIPPYDKTRGELFTNSSCILSNTQWFPSSDDDDDEWQLRAPRFMIIGARDSGTRMVASQLLKHSSLVSNSHATQELSYFSSPTLLLWRLSTRIHVWKARQQMYARDYPWKLLKHNSSLWSMDATPDYLFYSSTLSRSILCACPWIKIIVILRHPARRVYASFLRASQVLGWKKSLKDYVRLDMETMERVGLIGPHPKDNVEEAWQAYLSFTTDGPVGRSFYEIQLQQWFAVLREMGRDPLEAVHVIRYEEWILYPEREYRKVLDFLGLPPEKSVVVSAPTEDSIAISQDDQVTMRRLQKFFRPYNKRLYKLLGEEWNGCWDDE